MQQVSPMVKQIGQLIDARIRTLETNLKAEIKATEDRMTKSLKSEIKGSEERITKKVHKVEDKLDKKIGRNTGLS